MNLTAILLVLAMTHKPLVPAGGAKPVGPYIPGLETADYVYASGQGASDANGHRAPDIETQTRQAIINVRVILEAAGLGLADVVSVQFYLLDLKNLPTADRVYHEEFGTPGPARVILGTARMPTDTPVEITVVARKKGAAAGVAYLPAVYGKDAADAESKLQGHNFMQRVDYSTSAWTPGWYQTTRTWQSCWPAKYTTTTQWPAQWPTRWPAYLLARFHCRACPTKKCRSRTKCRWTACVQNPSCPS